MAYNGWSNYETWNVALWIGNEEGSCRYWEEVSQQCWDDARDTPSVNARLTGREPFSHQERATLELSKRLKDEHETAMHEMLEESGRSCSMWADLLGAALSEVDWHEIADGMISEVDKTADEVSEEEEIEAE